MTKTEEYQNALNYITSEVFTGGNSILEAEAEAIKKLLQPLIDQTKTPTLEEVKKEWEELGYEIYQEKYYIAMKNKTKKMEITIKFNDKYYFKRDDENFWEIITLQEHQLLTKTFKALGWFDEE